jgi:capsular exopolysaccharide synthesis family protein
VLPPNTGDAGFSNSVPSSSAPAGANGNGHGDLVPVSTGGGQLSLPGLYGWAGGAPLRPEILTARPDPLSLAKALRRRWALGALLGGVMGVTAAALAWFFLPMGYEVSAWVRVGRTPPALLGQPTYVDPKESDSFRQTQVQMVTSPLVLLSALRRDNQRLRNLPLIRDRADKVKWLQGTLRVGFRGDSDVMSISMRHDYPNQMLEIVNSVTKAYLEEVVEKDLRSKREELEGLRARYNQTVKSINQTKDRLNKIITQSGSTAADAAAAKESIKLQELSGLRQTRMNLDNHLREAQTKYLALRIQQQIAEDPVKREQIISSIIEEDPRVASLTNELWDAQRQIGQMSENIKDGRKSAIARSYAMRLRSKQQEIEELKTQLRPMVLEKFNMQTMEAINAEIKIVSTTYKQAKDDINALDEQIKDLEDELQTIRTYNGEIESIRGELEPQEKLAQELHQKIGARELDLSLKPRIELIELAEAPEGYSYWVRYTLVGFFAVCGFGLTLLGFAYREFLDRRVLSANQISEGLGVRVMGSLPDLSNKARKRLAGRSGDGAALITGLMSESIDSVRTMLLHGVRSKNTQVILVTSALEQEGKSTVASQLAASLARCGKRTLLVDGDLRRPAAHLLFDMPNDIGLSEVLRGEAELEEAVQPTQAPDLWLLPAGKCDLQSVQSLAAQKAREVCEKLRARFDFIILDSGPVLAYADTMLLGQIVDAAILSVLRDVSRAPKVYEAYEKLVSVNVDVLGAVVGGEATYTPRRRLPLAVNHSQH